MTSTHSDNLKITENTGDDVRGGGTRQKEVAAGREGDPRDPTKLTHRPRVRSPQGPSCAWVTSFVDGT